MRGTTRIGGQSTRTRHHRCLGVLPRLHTCSPLLALILGTAHAQDTAPPPQPSPTGTAATVERSADDLLLLGLYLQGALLSDELEGFPLAGQAGLEHPEIVLVPFGEICRLVGMGITVQPEKGIAAGDLPEGGGKFLLDLAAGTVTLGQRQGRFDASLIELHPNDIYVDAQLFGEWFTCKVTVDMRNLAVTLVSAKPFPLQARLERERRAAQMRGPMPLRDRGFPRMRQPYETFAGPYVDQSISLSASRGGSLDTQYSTSIAADLLHVGTHINLISSEHLRPKAQVMLNRVDPEGNMLGPLRLREVAAGEVSFPEMPLVTGAAMATGILASSYPLFAPYEFDTHTFAGILQAGWDVELYRDGVLLEYQAAGETGRYEFRDITLTFGLNRFRLVFHGPRGERREQEEDLNIGRAMLQPGKHYYRLAAHDTKTGGTQLNWQNDWGISDRLSLGGGIAITDEPSIGTSEYAIADLRGYSEDMFGRVNIAADVSGGWASRLSIQRRRRTGSVSLQYTRSDNFQSPVFDGGSQALAEGLSLRMDIRPRKGHSGPQTTFYELDHERARSGDTETRFATGQTMQLAGWNVSNFLDWRSANSAGSTTNEVVGHLLGAARRQGWDATAGVDYSIVPELRVANLGISLSGWLSETRPISIELAHTVDDALTRISASLNQQRGSWTCGLTARADTAGEASIALSLSTFVGYLPGFSGWHGQPGAQVNQAAICARVFLDANANGRFDLGDRPLKGVSFFVNDLSRDTLTDARGMAFLSGLASYQPLDISISTSTLEDPLWQPVPRGRRITTRPGAAALVDFPVIGTGEVSGMAYYKTPTATRYAAGVTVEVVGERGEVLASQRVAYDGFFSISNVPSGKHHLRIAEADCTRLQATCEAREIQIAPEGDFIDGADLTLQAP